MENQGLSAQFFDHPMKPFGVRELSRMLHLNTKTVMKQLKILVRKRVAIRVKPKGSFAHYEANRLSRRYKLMKSNALMGAIAESGLVDFLEQELIHNLL